MWWSIMPATGNSAAWEKPPTRKPARTSRSTCSGCSTCCATPHLREQRAGRVFNISSIGGFNGGLAGWGIYCATKFAVAGLTEAYATEMKDFGVRATVVYPGYFRTDFLTACSMGTPSQPIAAYQAIRDSLALHQDQIDGHQPGDPGKAAALIQLSGAGI